MDPGASRASPRDPLASGWTVEHVAETTSTNADLLATAAERPDRSVLRADHQTAGRGRLDRRWDAPRGANLLVSFLFHDVPAHPGELVQRLALAAADAGHRLTGLDIRLKWPNDLLVDDRKLAGILAERSMTGDVVVGIGLNVGWCPDGAARLTEGGAAVTPAELLGELLAAYDRLPADITSAYREALGTLGRRVRVELPSGVVEGTAIDVEPGGRLVVLDACAVTHRFAVGDIVHLRPATGA